LYHLKKIKKEELTSVAAVAAVAPITGVVSNDGLDWFCVVNTYEHLFLTSSWW
jgi:hypothetical protein